MATATALWLLLTTVSGVFCTGLWWLGEQWRLLGLMHLSNHIVESLRQNEDHLHQLEQGSAELSRQIETLAQEIRTDPPGKT